MAERMTRAEIVALPAVVSLDDSSRALGISRSKGQELARHDAYPVRVFRVGRSYRVSSATILEYLGLDIPEYARNGGDAA